MQPWLDWIRIGVTVATFICFVAWIVWFLNKDNTAKYQARAEMLLDDDDTTPVQIDELNEQQRVKK
jgi:cbb3-type cytochrome oxidase subunit 3